MPAGGRRLVGPHLECRGQGSGLIGSLGPALGRGGGWRHRDGGGGGGLLLLRLALRHVVRVVGRLPLPGVLGGRGAAAAAGPVAVVTHLIN